MFQSFRFVFKEVPRKSAESCTSDALTVLKHNVEKCDFDDSNVNRSTHKSVEGAVADLYRDNSNTMSKGLSCGDTLTVKIKHDNSRLRLRNDKGRIISYAKQGEKVRLVDNEARLHLDDGGRFKNQEHLWLKVKLGNGEEGWMSGEYLMAEVKDESISEEVASVCSESEVPEKVESPLPSGQVAVRPLLTDVSLEVKPEIGIVQEGQGHAGRPNAPGEEVLPISEVVVGAETSPVSSDSNVSVQAQGTLGAGEGGFESDVQGEVVSPISVVGVGTGRAQVSSVSNVEVGEKETSDVGVGTLQSSASGETIVPLTIEIAGNGVPSGVVSQGTEARGKQVVSVGQGVRQKSRVSGVSLNKKEPLSIEKAVPGKVVYNGVQENETGTFSLGNGEAPRIVASGVEVVANKNQVSAELKTPEEVSRSVTLEKIDDSERVKNGVRDLVLRKLLRSAADIDWGKKDTFYHGSWIHGLYVKCRDGNEIDLTDIEDEYITDKIRGVDRSLAWGDQRRLEIKWRKTFLEILNDSEFKKASQVVLHTTEAVTGELLEFVDNSDVDWANAFGVGTNGGVVFRKITPKKGLESELKKIITSLQSTLHKVWHGKEMTVLSKSDFPDGFESNRVLSVLKSYQEEIGRHVALVSFVVKKIKKLKHDIYWNADVLFKKDGEWLVVDVEDGFGNPFNRYEKVVRLSELNQMGFTFDEVGTLCNKYRSQIEKNER